MTDMDETAMAVQVVQAGVQDYEGDNYFIKKADGTPG